MPTNFTSSKPAAVFADFVFNEAGTELISCANSVRPVSTNYNEKTGVCRIKFRLSDCQNCPRQKECAPQMNRNYAWQSLSWKTVNRAQVALFMETEEFKELAHFRSGVEAIPSLLRRKYQVDKIPAHGKQRTRLHYGFKIGAINFKKLLDYSSRQDKSAQKTRTA